MAWRSRVARALLASRLSADISQLAMAAHLDISVREVRRIEGGRVNADRYVDPWMAFCGPQVLQPTKVDPS